MVDVEGGVFEVSVSWTNWILFNSSLLVSYFSFTSNREHDKARHGLIHWLVGP